MAKYKCPSCGASYNGKRCRSCLYESFSEEIAHGNHVHEGEPLIIDAPFRRPIRRKNPFDCEKKTKKPAKGRLGVILAIALALLGPVSDIVGDVISHTMDSIARSVPEPEPAMAVPETAMILYADGDVQVLAQWKNGQEYTSDGIRIWIENHSGYDLTFTATDMIVNDYMMDSVYFYSTVRDGSLSMATLYLDEDALADAGIRAATDIRFQLEAWEQDSFETILTTHRIDLAASPPANTTVHVAPEGALIYDQDGIRVSFLGYREDDYHPEDVSEGQLLFHIENETDRYLQVYPLTVTVDGEISDLSFWCQLYPGTKAISTMYLYSLEELGIDAAEELFPLELTLEFTDRADYDFYFKSGTLLLTEDCL